MQGKITAIALVVVALTAIVVGLWLWKRARGEAPAGDVATDGPEAMEHVDRGSTSTSRPRNDGGRRGGRSGGAASGDAGGARERQGVTVDVFGGDRDGGGAAVPGRDEARERGREMPELPMARLGASMGIDTSMDDKWTLEDEAAGWFSPMEDDFQASRPLGPDRYKEILGDHRETATDVLKRSGEIGDELGADAGIAFLDAYNELVEGYRDEAYGTP